MKLLWTISLVLIAFCISGCSSSALTRMTYYTSSFDTDAVYELYNEDKYEEAEQLVLDYLENNPDDYKALSEKAYLLISKGENEEGIILIDYLLSITPDNDTLLNNKSWAYNRLNLYTLALEYAEKALEHGITDEYELSNKAYSLYKLERYEEALICCELSIDENSDTSYAYYVKGLCQKANEAYDDAFVSLRKAYEISPYNYSYYNDLISVCRELKNYNKMIEFSNKRLRVYPKDSTSYYYIAEALGCLKQYENALQYYDDLLEISDYDADTWYEKCKIYLKLDNRENAYESIKKVLELDETYFFYIDFTELKDLRGYKDFDEIVLSYLYKADYE